MVWIHTSTLVTLNVNKGLCEGLISDDTGLLSLPSVLSQTGQTHSAWSSWIDFFRYIRRSIIVSNGSVPFKCLKLISAPNMLKHSLPVNLLFHPSLPFLFSLFRSNTETIGALIFIEQQKDASSTQSLDCLVVPSRLPVPPPSRILISPLHPPTVHHLSSPSSTICSKPVYIYIHISLCLWDLH